MASLEERLTALEQENAALKKAVELQLIALRALVTKDAFEALRETNNKIFDVLTSHDQLANERLGDLQTQVIQLDGKIVGLQTEMRQRFEQQATATNARFETLEGRLGSLDGRMGSFEQGVNARFEQQDKKLDHILDMLVTLTAKPDQGQ